MLPNVSGVRRGPARTSQRRSKVPAVRLGLVAALLLLSIVLAPAAPAYLFDMGTARSALWAGFTRVTAESVFSDQATFGWQGKDGLKSQARAYTNLVENRSRGAEEPPPIWTNPITEDAVLGTRENAFLIRAAPGDYEVVIVCGTSEAMRSQFFDFTVRVGNAERRVQFEGGYQFRVLRLQTRIGAELLAISFDPRSKWVVNAIGIWTAADAARIEKEFVQPFEEWAFRLPPDEWAKWKLEPGPDPEPMQSLAESDRERGFAVFARHYLECVYPGTRPRTEDLNPRLRLFASLGEYEPITFTVHPLKDLVGATVRVSDIGPVPARNIDIRHVRFLRARPNYRVQYRYRVVPDVLEHFERLDLPAGENARFWLTVKVPEDAAPGLYHGRATFECSGGKCELPIALRILPIRLREDPAKIFGIYYRHPYDLLAGADDDVSREHFRRRAELEHADLAAHGTRNVTLTCWSPPADTQGNFRFDWDLLAEKLALWRRHGFVGPIVMSINTGGVYEKHVGDRYGSHLRGVQQPPESFGREITAMVRAIETERRQRGWPEFLYYPVDEPSTDAASVGFMVTVLKACKDAGVRTYVTADITHGQFAPLKPYVDVWCKQPFALEREAVLADAQRGVEHWCYPNHINGENDHTPVAGARMTYGFGFWRSGYRALIPWIYSYSTGDPFNYLDGSAMDFFNRHEPDGTPMPVALWEAYREGYDDYRYIYTLEQLVAEAKQNPRADVKNAVAAAMQELRQTWSAIRVQPKYKYDGLWSPPEFDVYRWLIARKILELRPGVSPGY